MGYIVFKIKYHFRLKLTIFYLDVIFYRRVR